MIKIKNIAGEVIYTSKTAKTIKQAVEEAVNKGISLKDADLRGADLYKAKLHGADLREANLSEAYLQDANLCKANLYEADLHGADLRGAYLVDAILSEANLCRACLVYADLHSADLCSANLRHANLSDANLYRASLCMANLQRTNLRDVNFQYADLRGAKNVPYIPLACPSEGTFIGWKKVVYGNKGYLVKLSIPEDAKRSSATSKKCRCNKAEVLEIINLKEGKPVSLVVNREYFSATTYEVGKMVYPDSFDEDRWNECSHGIHFFVNKEDAINYEL